MFIVYFCSYSLKSCTINFSPQADFLSSFDKDKHNALTLDTSRRTIIKSIAHEFFSTKIQIVFNQIFFFQFIIFQKMQVESGLNKWNGRVPPLDLSNVSVCPRETEQRWHKVQNPRQMAFEMKRSSDGLPIGEYSQRSMPATWDHLLLWWIHK